MAAPRRSKAELTETRSRVAHLYLKGLSQRDIAEAVGISRDMVVHDLEAIRTEWKRSAIFDFNLAEQMQLAKIDVVEKEMWDAWERSKANRDVTVTRQRRRSLPAAGDAVLDNIAEAIKRTEQRDADPRFMQVIMDCIKERNKILGLYAAQEIRHSGAVTEIREVFYEAAAVQPGADEGLMRVIGGTSNGALPAGTNGHDSGGVLDLNAEPVPSGA